MPIEETELKEEQVKVDIAINSEEIKLSNERPFDINQFRKVRLRMKK